MRMGWDTSYNKAISGPCLALPILFLWFSVCGMGEWGSWGGCGRGDDFRDGCQADVCPVAWDIVWGFILLDFGCKKNIFYIEIIGFMVY